MNEDHDQRFKTLIREFFADFLRLFLANWAARFDLNQVEWLDKEVLPEPPDGARHVLDLVAKLRALEPTTGHDPDQPVRWLALIHIEIESPDRKTSVESRLPSYYRHLKDKSNLPVLPIVIYLRVGLEGIGAAEVHDICWDFRPQTTRYLYVGLPGLDAVQYLEGESWLGVALSALMKIDKERIAWLGAEALRRLAEAPLTDQQRFLLCECVDAYLPLDPKSREVFERIKLGEPYTKVRAMNQTTYERGEKRGEERGELRGEERGRTNTQVQIAEAILRERYGPLDQTALKRLREFPLNRVQEILLQSMHGKSLAELGLAD